ncbi:hypothetical protein HKD37_06G015655 [Glycine soja]
MREKGVKKRKARTREWVGGNSRKKEETGGQVGNLDLKRGTVSFGLWLGAVRSQSHRVATLSFIFHHSNPNPSFLPSFHAKTKTLINNLLQNNNDPLKSLIPNPNAIEERSNDFESRIDPLRVHCSIGDDPGAAPEREGA